MRKLDYSKETSIVLKTEDYTNAGLTQKDMMKVVEKFDSVLRVGSYGINDQVQVHIKYNDPLLIENLVSNIRMVFEVMLCELQGNSEKKLQDKGTPPTLKETLEEWLFQIGDVSLPEDNWILVSQSTSGDSIFQDCIWVTGWNFTDVECKIFVTIQLANEQIAREESWSLGQFTDGQLETILDAI